VTHNTTDDDVPKGREEVLRVILSPEFREELSNADVILGLDEATYSIVVLFGGATLRATASGELKECQTVLKPILQATDELEALLAAVTFAKGYHEYEENPRKRHKHRHG
jgi:hypothetical protein